MISEKTRSVKTLLDVKTFPHKWTPVVLEIGPRNVIDFQGARKMGQFHQLDWSKLHSLVIGIEPRQPDATMILFISMALWKTKPTKADLKAKTNLLD